MAQFKAGHHLSKGRPKGSRNKRTYEFLTVLDQKDFCPATALIECYEEAKKIYDSYGVIYEALSKGKEATGDPYPVEDRAHTYLKIASDIAKELASYAYPKLKNTEMIKINPLENMTPEQRLGMMKEAVLLLEMQVKKNGSQPV